MPAGFDQSFLYFLSEKRLYNDTEKTLSLL